MEYEIKQLNKIKIFDGDIENVPQLLGTLYVYHLEEMTQNTALALSASILSITAAILSYLIERDTADTKVVQYYLTTECSPRISKPNTPNSELVHQQHHLHLPSKQEK